MPDLIKLSRIMNKKIEEIEEDAGRLEELAISKAEAAANYDKALGLCIIQLKNGGSVEVDGNIISNPPATITERIARAACWRELLEKDKADALYGACRSRISARESQLNGYQSINRYLSEVEKGGG